MGGYPIRDKLIIYFKKHPGVQIFVDDLAAELEEDRERVLSGVGNLMRENRLPGLEKIAIAGPWIYKGPPTASNGQVDSKSIFEFRWKTKKGDLIIESDDGTLYRAVELE